MPKTYRGYATTRRGSDTVTDRVYRALKRDIVTGALKPGDSVPVRQLGKRFRASRTPVREALIRLAQEAFVAIHPRRGVFVTGVSPRELHEICQVREMLEGLAARLACQHADKATLDRLESELRTARSTGLYKDLVAVGMKVHAWVCHASNNATLAAMITTLHSHMARIFALFADNQVVAKESYAQYQAIIDAIRDNDPDAAEASMRRHIALAKEHMLKGI